MPWGAAGAAVLGVGSAIAGNEAADSAKDAQASTTAANNQLARETLDYTSKLNLPAYKSDATRRAYQDLMLGLPLDQVRANYADAMKVGAFGSSGSSGGATRGFDDGIDWRGYFDANPDLGEYVSRYGYGKIGGNSVEEFARNHYTNFGQYEGRGAPPAMATKAVAGGSGGSADGSFLDGWSAGEWLKQTPGYQFRLDEGTKALERSAAARGALYSGATMKGLDRYSQDYASNEWSRLFNQLGGSGAASDLSADANNYSQSVQANNQAFGNAARESAYARGDAWGEGLGALAGGFGAYRRGTNTSG